MLTIRNAQLHALGRARADAFLRKAVQVVRRHWPVQAAELGAERLNEFVADGIEKAKRYEIDDERNLCRFLNVQMLLGADFEQDPRFPWARIILEEEAFTSARKMERVGEFIREMHATPSASEQGVS